MGTNKRQGRKKRKVVFIVAVIVILAAIAAAMLLVEGPSPQTATPAPPPGRGALPDASPAPAAKMETMEVAKAVMVTVELDFGSRPPGIAEALTQIERRYQPDDGIGRTFSILDAYGEPTSDGKLHISMHVSSEKPGVGSLIFRRSGEVLWQSRITPSSQPHSWNKGLTVYIDNGKGSSQIIDGSNNPASIMGAKVRDLGVLVRDYWPDGAEREVTFVYSACGCPVKVMTRRAGEKSARTKELPVIFPDDPDAVLTISRLMGW